MGAQQVETLLPPLLKAAQKGLDFTPVWVCDPMHGNTFLSPSGRKTRRFDDVLNEIRGFFLACGTEDVWPGGMHIELTGEDVTECLGGSADVLDSQLDDRYLTTCDPRLNARQSLDLAYRVAELLRN
jgi:3-deoxy-7-phosphoheptulonate synthase